MLEVGGRWQAWNTRWLPTPSRHQCVHSAVFHYWPPSVYCQLHCRPHWQQLSHCCLLQALKLCILRSAHLKAVYVVTLRRALSQFSGSQRTLQMCTFAFFTLQYYRILFSLPAAAFVTDRTIDKKQASTGHTIFRVSFFSNLMMYMYTKCSWLASGYAPMSEE